MHRIRVVDSHTAGEPTRVVVDGGPDLGTGPLATRRERLRAEFDHYRSAVVNEPRGSDVVVGALLVPPHEASCAAGVIFFNNVGTIGMCGHGTIGVVTTLAHLGRLRPGTHRIDTPVGVVTVVLHDDGEVSVTNVRSFRAHRAVAVEVDGETIRGDVAWGGNWFFLARSPARPLTLHNAAALSVFCGNIRRALNRQRHPDVDHVELFGAPTVEGARSRNFVLCPGGAYDRSPCGTGTSAKLACLAADGELPEGETWVQEGILGTTFAASYRWVDRAAGRIEPTIRGRAHVNAEATQIVDERDPFRWGIRVR